MRLWCGCWPGALAHVYRWQGLGLLDALPRRVAALSRRAVGRRPGPRLAVTSTQSIPCIPACGPRGCNATKKMQRRKRVALVDADGTWLAIAVVLASV